MPLNISFDVDGLIFNKWGQTPLKGRRIHAVNVSLDLKQAMMQELLTRRTRII